jgi:uncharacterized RDD family membrane protein YckC
MQPSFPTDASGAFTPTAAPDAVAAAGRIAPLGDRAIAAIIDLILMFGPFSVIGMWIATRFGGVTGSGFELNGGPGLLAIVLWVTAGFLYFWLFEGLFGTTLGKLIMGLRMRTLAGTRIGLGRSFTRTALRVVDGFGVYLLGLIFALTSHSRQRLGDRVAGTVVVQANAPPATRLAAAGAWAGALAACFVVAFVLHAGAPASGGPQFTDAELGTGQADDGSIAGRSDTFATNAPQVMCVFHVSGLTPDSAIKAVFVEQNVEGIAPNTSLAEKTVSGGSGDSSGTFNLTPPSGGFLPGQYRLDLYFGDSLAKSLPFTIAKS